MKYAVICALALAPFVCADETAKAVKVEQLLTIMNVAQQQKLMMDQMTQMVTGQMKEQMAKQGNISSAEMAKMEDRQKRLMALIAERTSWEKMKPVFIKAYTDTFSEPEIDGMLTFYKSAVGKAMIEKQPMLNSKIMTSVQAQMTDLMPQIEAIIKQ